MPLAFLAPVFLAGLAALAIPVLIHLANRPKKQVVEFPSLMFLERVEYRASSRKRLRDLVLFALRSLALVLVVAAFTRPYLDRPDAPATAPDGGLEVVVLLDRSASMAPGDRMARARAAVAEVAEGLQRGDRATLVAFDREAVAANRATDQAAVLRAAVDTIRSGAGATRLTPALRLAQSILSGSPLPRRELVLVSDFQRVAWEPESAPSMPAGTAIRTVDVGGEEENVFVADVRLGRERFSGRDRARVAATVASRGWSGEREVELVLDGRVLQRRTVGLTPGAAATVAFDPVTVPDRPARGSVRAGRDALAADDAFHFVLSPGRALRVLVVRPPSGGAPYAARALDAGPDHDVAAVSAPRLRPGSLSDFDVVVLDGADPGDAAALASYVEAGGGLLAVLGPRSRAGVWDDTDLLPGALGGTRDAARGSGLVIARDLHPVFEPFRSAGGGLGGARFYRYRELEPHPGAEVLARFDDGAPAVVAGSVGGGRVVALTSPLDGVWSDLVLQPGFVPLLHRLMRHVAGREPAPRWRTVGDLLDTDALLGAPAEGETGLRGAVRPGAGPVLLTPGDEALAVTAGALHPLREAGFYELRDPRTGDAVPVAVNTDRRESEPERVAPEAVRAVIAGDVAAPVAASLAPEDRERRQGLWWYFLAAAFVMLAAETALSNRLSGRGLPRAAEGGRR